MFLSLRNVLNESTHQGNYVGVNQLMLPDNTDDRLVIVSWKVSLGMFRLH